MMGITLSSIFAFLMLFATNASGKMYSDPIPTRTILFKVTRPNSPQVSYLFGTHHAFGRSFFDTLTHANQSLASCDLLIKENLNIPGQGAQDIINRRTEITKWEKFLHKDDLAFVKELFASSPTDFNKMTPTEMFVFLNRHYNEQICLSKEASDTYRTLDDYIGAKAESSGLKLIGLETTEEQIELINQDVEGMPRKVHKRRLSGVIGRIRDQNPGECGETGWYSQMDIDYQLQQPCRNTLVLSDRNDKWMKTIDSYLETNNCFIAVGLSHLMYACGLISRLQERGYTITQLNAK